MKLNKTYSPLKIIFSGGGTGGHIYPAIAVANQIKEWHPEAEILFVGAEGKMEMSKVPQAGFKIIGLWISGFQRRLTLANLLFPIKVIISVLKSSKILKSFKPQVVAGFGGYASSPIMLAATWQGVATLIQEQNSYAGVANKAVASKVQKICVAYEDMDRYFPQSKIVFTGNPVRKDIFEIEGKAEEAVKYFSIKKGKSTILVLGGSLGARTINESIIVNIQKLLDSEVQVLWQTGKLYFKEMNERMVGYDDDNIRVLEFIERMDLAYAVADIIVSRAGALSISELCLIRKPVIFVPSPNVAEDHQTKNAKALSNRGGALIVEDKNAVEELIDVALKLLEDTDKRTELSTNIGLMAKPKATEEIAKEILKLAEYSG